MGKHFSTFPVSEGICGWVHDVSIFYCFCIRLQGEHLLDSFDDGTEMADPVERDDCSINDDDDDVENLDKDKQRDIGRE